MQPKRIVIVSGPSCVGKGPLLAAVRRHHPEIIWADMVLCASRPPRLKKSTGQYEVHGRDYYFLPRGLFASLDPQRFLVAGVRSIVQAIDLALLGEMLGEHDLIVAELHTTFGRVLADWMATNRPEVQVVRVFISPVSDEELQTEGQAQGKDVSQVVYELMKAKLERRGEDSPEKVEDRASHAWGEMQAGKEYDRIIVNHAGEDDVEAWSDPLSAEAKAVLGAFVTILCEHD